MGGLKIDLPGAKKTKQWIISDQDAAIKLGKLRSDHVLTVIYQKSREDMEAPATLVEASRLAIEFFGYVGRENLVGKTAAELIEMISPYLSNKKEFLADQSRVQEELQKGRIAFARVPMIISDKHPVDRFHGKAYHPIIALSSKERDRRGVLTEYMTVLYLDLSHVPFVADIYAPKAA